MADKSHQEGAASGRLTTPVINAEFEPVRETTLQDVVQIFRRHVRLFFGVIATVMVGVAVFLVVVTPKYQGVGQVLLHDGAGGKLRNIRSVIETPGVDVSSVPNAVKILTSRVLVGSIVEALDLENDPELNEKLSETAAVGKNDAAQLPKSGAAGDSEDTTAPAAGAPAVDVAGRATKPTANGEATIARPTADAAAGPNQATDPDEVIALVDPEALIASPSRNVKAHIVDAFLKNLEVSSERRSRVVDVKFESTDPKKAARIVNELMKTYLLHQVRYQKQAIDNATDRLKQIVEEVRLEVVAAENAVQALRAETQLVETPRGDSTTGQQLAELNSRLVQARAEEAAVAARLKQMLTLLKSPGSMTSAPEILASPLIQRLRQTETELLRQRSDLSSRYGEKHPKMIKVRAELRDHRQKIQDEMNKIVEGLSHEAAVARAKRSALEAGLADLKSEAISVNTVQIRLRELEQEVKTKREQYQNFLVRLRETTAQRDMIESTARIVSYAEVPTKPSFPNKKLTVGLGGMSAGVLALFLVFAAEALRRTFETSNEIEGHLGIRPLGVFPRVAHSRGMPGLSSGSGSNVSNFQLGQSVRNVRSSLFLANNSRHPRSILVTSAKHGEGKTTFVLSYASFCVANGQKVIVLDCDFGRPKLHKILGVSNSPGFSEALLDEESLKSVIRTAANAGFDYITNGNLAIDRPELLEENSVKRILDALAWDYDVVIMDSSPVLAMTSAYILAKLADSTVFLVQWRKTRRDLAKASVRRLYGIGAAIGGFVMTNVPAREAEGPGLAIDVRGDRTDHEFGQDEDRGFLQRYLHRSNSA